MQSVLSRQFPYDKQNAQTSMYEIEFWVSIEVVLISLYAQIFAVTIQKFQLLWKYIQKI